MSDGQLNSFPVKELQHRYTIVWSGVYIRLEALNIKLEKLGLEFPANPDWYSGG